MKEDVNTEAGSLLRQEFYALRENFAALTICWNNYVRLYESGIETNLLLERSAKMFFKDYYRILRSHIVIEICKITDPPKMGKRENLTIPNIYDQLLSSDMISEELKALKDSIDKFRNLINNQRNRLVAHYDKDSVVTDTGCYYITFEEMSLFFSDLHKFSDQVEKLTGLRPQKLSGSSPEKGGVVDLLEILRKGIGNDHH